MVSRQVDTLPKILPATHGVVLRRLAIEDASAIWNILERDKEISKKFITWTAGAKSEDDISRRIAEFVALNELRYAILLDDQVIGYIGAGKVEADSRGTEYHIGYFCSPEHRGKGVVTTAASSLVAAMTQYVDVTTFALYIADMNEASQAVAKKLGFARTEETAFDDALQVEERRYERVLPSTSVVRNNNEHQVDVLTLPELKPSGTTQSIVAAIRSNAWLHTTDVWVYRTEPKLQMLFQQRPFDSPTYAGKLDCSVAGYLEAGEDGQTGGARELAEELGLEAQPSELTPFGRRLNAMIDHRGRERRIVANTNILEWNHEVSDLKVDADEVHAVFWVDVDDLIELESGGELKAVGQDATGKAIEQQFGLDDFAYNIDSYYFRIAERIQRKVNNGR